MELGVLQEATGRKKIRGESQKIRYLSDPGGSLQVRTSQRENLGWYQWLELKKLPLLPQYFFFSCLQLTNRTGKPQCCLFAGCCLLARPDHSRQSTVVQDSDTEHCAESWGARPCFWLPQQDSPARRPQGSFRQAASPVLEQCQYTDPMGLARAVHTHTWGTGVSNGVSVKGHAPEDPCQHVRHYLQLLLGGSSQG